MRESYKSSANHLSKTGVGARRMNRQKPQDERDTANDDPIRNRQDGADPADEPQGKGHGPLKGTDTAATTDLEYAERERGKRTTM